MKPTKQSKMQKRNQRNRLYMKIALVAIATALIVTFMPRGDKFGYQYELGQPWRYGQLMAKFKFPVYKNDSLVQQERDSAERRFQPYYTYDEQVRARMQNLLHTKKADEWNGENAHLYVQHISEMLDTVYKRGVLSVDDYSKLKDEQRKAIRVVRNNQAIHTRVSQLLSTKSAYEYIMSASPEMYSRLAMQEFNVIDLIQPNVTFDSEKSKIELDNLMQTITPSSGYVQAGQKIIDRGELVTPEMYDKLASYEREMSRHAIVTGRIPYKLIGQIVFVLAIFIALATYVSLFRKDYFDNYSNGILLFSLPVVFCVFASLMVTYKFLNVFMLPCCMVPIVIRVFHDSRTAFMFHCGMSLIISLVLVNNYEFLIIQLAAGMVAIQTLRELSERSQIIRTAFLIFMVYVVIYTSYSLIHENRYAPDTWMYVCFLINGVLLLFTYPMLWMFEKTFGFVSDVTLVELSSINHPLLRQLTEKAPGTFQHSMQVANLAAEVANKLDAKVQLVRTAALYHDVGKIERPVFFTENQSGVSPHKRLKPEDSARIITGHVSLGVEYAEKYHLPDIIKRFILTHHGAGKAKYFYITYKNQHPDEEVNEKFFSYPGPNPSTKEEAILMMCDSVEAASRSLGEYTEENIDDLVEKIINGQMADGFFSQSSITFKDIDTAKSVLKDKLKTIYHTRISYPELQGDANASAQDSSGTPATDSPS